MKADFAADFVIEHTFYLVVINSSLIVSFLKEEGEVVVSVGSVLMWKFGQNKVVFVVVEIVEG